MKSVIEILRGETSTEEDGMWLAIDRAFATPVGHEVTKEYVPTQIIAELFKSTGFDGIFYKSLLANDGFNLALFDLDDAEVISCGLWKATSIRFDFKSTGEAYFVGDDDSKSAPPEHDSK
jgi:RES domain